MTTTTTAHKDDHPKHSTPYRDNASHILDATVDVTAPEPERTRQLIHVATTLCPKLLSYDSQNDHAQQTTTTTNAIPNDDFDVSPLSGGLSNELFVVQSKRTALAVLVRLHPSSETTDTTNMVVSVVDRNVENTVSAWLSSVNTGPKYYGRFRNGRVEEFYSQHTPLLAPKGDMIIYGVSHIAKLLADFHQLSPPHDTVVAPTHPQQGDYVTRIDAWLEMVRYLYRDIQPPPQAETTLVTPEGQLWDRLEREWTWLKEALVLPSEDYDDVPDQDTNAQAAAAAARRVFSQVVFCHMDCQSLNLLRDTTKTNHNNNNNNNNNNNKNIPEDDHSSLIKLIDFEYAAWNPRGVDLANTFCEYCDMNHCRANYQDEYPTAQHQTDFLLAYLHTVDRWGERDNDTTTSRNLGQAYWKDDATTATTRDAFFQAAQLRIGQYTLVSHLGWSVWSLIQHKLSNIDFDYIHYAQHRMDGYDYMKRRFFLDA